jgi:hypothetical protein
MTFVLSADKASNPRAVQCFERVCSIAWGDAPTWVACIGTVGALAAALFQIHREQMARRKLEEAARGQSRREQAESISAWIDQEEPGDLEPGRAVIAIGNQSQRPSIE